MKKTTTLDGKMMKYAAAAGTLFAAAGVADAQVIYTNVDPDFNHPGGATTVGLDLNNDGTFDYLIASIDTTITNSNGTFDVKTTLVAPYGTAGNEIAGSAPSGYNYALALDNSTMVDANLNWIAATNTMAYNVNSSNPYNENWNGVTDKFLGLRFDINGSTHFGWARMDVDADADVWTMKDYAYDGTPNTPISTDMALGVATDVVAENILVFNSNNVLYVNINGELSNGTVKIMNLAGQVVVDESLNGTRNNFNLANLHSGIYLVTTTFNEGVATKRIFVK